MINFQIFLIYKLILEAFLENYSKFFYLTIVVLIILVLIISLILNTNLELFLYTICLYTLFTNSKWKNDKL